MTDANKAAEEWKSIPDLDGYEISDQGNVRRLVGREYRTIQSCGSGNKRSPYYRFTAVTKSGERKMVTVHRAVLSCFVRQPYLGEMACHIDGNPHNNLLSNLRWGTNSDNQKDSVKHGTHSMSKIRGENVNNARLKGTDIPVIRDLLKTHTQDEIAKHYGVSPATISAIHLGRTWSHIS